ncbi:hypothetical protein U9M48_009024 [Paspalum notatum var. saurae]|uniref:Uncharacterized protein n=1 Tax=Paspalum notatum var. saurae TaxID=547442 RepID=A0AAQ3SRG4_PASNO
MTCVTAMRHAAARDGHCGTASRAAGTRPPGAGSGQPDASAEHGRAGGPWPHARLWSARRRGALLQQPAGSGERTETTGEQASKLLLQQAAGGQRQTKITACQGHYSTII